MDGSVSFFELGVDDTDKARAFYGRLFGWTFGDAGNGASIKTPNIPGGLHGGDPGVGPYLFFRVSDLSSALDQVRELGGQGVEEVSEADEGTTSEFGRFVLCTDDQGSKFGLHQPPA